VKVTVKCPKCGTEGQLDIPDEKWTEIEGNVIVGRVTSGRVCSHEFSVEIDRSGKILKYDELKPAAEPQLRPVKFTVESAARNIGEDIVAALLTAAISEQRVLLVGADTVTRGIKDFMLRFLPESVELDALIKTVTREEYDQLSEETRSWMTVHLKDRKIVNSAFTEDQTEWIRRVIMRAKLLSRQTEKAAEELIQQEVMKLRTTVSMLRHLAAKSKEARDNKTSLKPENAEASSE
ncbi:MAG: hypothetical protein ACFFDP_11285, partial [Promethearchaeota archaeon]